MAIFAIPCDCDQDPRCERCDEGWRPFSRCPAAVVREAGLRMDLQSALDSYIQYEGRNVLPAPGGWLDQAAGFCSVVRFIDRLRPRWDRQREYEKQVEQDRLRAKRAARGIRR